MRASPLEPLEPYQPIPHQLVHLEPSVPRQYRNPPFNKMDRPLNTWDRSLNSRKEENDAPILAGLSALSLAEIRRFLDLRTPEGMILNERDQFKILAKTSVEEIRAALNSSLN